MSSSNNLQQVRERLGLTKAELERRAGVSTTTIRQLENGKISSTRRTTIMKLFRALNEAANGSLSLEDVFPGK